MQFCCMQGHSPEPWMLKVDFCVLSSVSSYYDWTQLISDNLKPFTLTIGVLNLLLESDTESERHDMTHQ